MAIDHRALGVDLFNKTWTMMETPTRSPEEGDAMIHMAYASAYHRCRSATARGASGSAHACTASSGEDDEDRAVMEADFATIDA